MNRSVVSLAASASRAARARAGKNRRKGQGHPYTALFMDYSQEETEFANAIETWKNRTGRKFPTWSEVLRVVRSLGYSKQPQANAARVA